MAATEFPQETRHSSHSSTGLYSRSAKLKIEFVSDKKCAVDSRPRVDRFSPAQRRVLTADRKGAPKRHEHKGNSFDPRGEKTCEVMCSKARTE